MQNEKVIGDPLLDLVLHSKIVLWRVLCVRFNFAVSSISSYFNLQNFRHGNASSLKVTQKYPEVEWDLIVPSPKIAYRDIFWLGFVSDSVQCIKLCTCAKFHAWIVKCTIHAYFSVEQIRYHFNFLFVMRRMEITRDLHHSLRLIFNVVLHFQTRRLKTTALSVPITSQQCNMFKCLQVF